MFSFAGPANDAQKKRAALVLSSMAALGTRFMAVGERDLNGGVAFLNETLKGSGLTLLSANLIDADKKHPFAGSAVVKHEGVTVAFIGVSPEGPVSQQPLEGTDVLAAIKAELKKLPRHDVTVVLAAMPYQASMVVADGLTGVVDVIIQTHETRGNSPPQRMANGVYVVPGGGKGRAVGELDFVLGSAGPLIDLGEAQRQKEQAGFVQKQIETMEARRANTTDATAKKQVDDVIRDLKVRKAEYEKTSAPPKNARTMLCTIHMLDSSVADDPELKKQVLEVEPTYMGSH